MFSSWTNVEVNCARVIGADGVVGVFINDPDVTLGERYERTACGQRSNEDHEDDASSVGFVHGCRRYQATTTASPMASKG